MPKEPIDSALFEAINRSRKAYQIPSSAKPQFGKPNAVTDFVTYPDGILKEFIDKFEENEQVKEQILQCIPTQFKKNIRGYRLINNQLSLLVDNAATATQLRFVKTEILNSLRQSGLWNLSNIAVKIDPNI